MIYLWRFCRNIVGVEYFFYISTALLNAVPPFIFLLRKIYPCLFVQYRPERAEYGIGVSKSVADPVRFYSGPGSGLSDQTGSWSHS
jgi:hypothetical protein